ncbi:three-helix bundle dimerization domain-containing protein [Streptomyces sp. NPDC048425]|uniref:three-helix bundle dimerization domain-containing protein n=1 Tax=Streptomyces sp. NPDC048425 TaxID=3365548 RepID=UPI00371E3F4B
MAESVVEATVRSAYGSFRQAGVRTCVPILVGRRARRVLGADAAVTTRRRKDRPWPTSRAATADTALARCCPGSGRFPGSAPCRRTAASGWSRT